MYGRAGSASQRGHELLLDFARYCFEICAVRQMSSPPIGRALAFPVVWGTGGQRRIAGAQPAEIRSPSDEELMAWMQAKDPKGLDLLYGRYSRLVFGIAIRILTD